MLTNPSEFQYADAWRLVADTFAAGFRPPDQISVADYAVRHRRLSNFGGGYVGPWSHDEAPYLVEPMDCVTSELYFTMAIVGPGQFGKTEVAHNWLLHSVGARPGNFLWYMPAGPLLESHVKTRIDPMILGLPFNLAWLLCWIVLTTLCLWAAYRVESARAKKDGGAR